MKRVEKAGPLASSAGGKRYSSRLDKLATPHPDAAEVWLLVLPFGRTIRDVEASVTWFATLRKFAQSLNEKSILAILTSAQDAAETWPKLSNLLKFQLWAAAKLLTSISTDARHLPEDHAALLILSKYNTSLQHTKTRIAYTYCPSSDKTTKDYGGKKHTYHEYGTLLSDVWRDIAWAPETAPTEIADRLADLFGLDPYRSPKVVSLTRVPELQPGANPLCRPLPQATSAKAMNSRLHLGDCLERLKEIPDNCIDFCFADPPYNLSKCYDRWNDALDSVEYFNWCDRWLDELARVLKRGRTCAVLNIPQWAVRHFAYLKERLTFQNWIAAVA